MAIGDELERPQTAPIDSVDRALRILDLLAGLGAGGGTLADVALASGLHKTTAHRTLAALRHRQYVAQDPSTGRYTLGPAALALAESYLREENLPRLLHAGMTALCAEAGELVHLGVLSGFEVVYLDKIEPQRPVRVWSAVGRRIWAVNSALGRAILAYRGVGRAVLETYVSAAEGGSDRGGSIDRDRVWHEVERARREGYAVELGDGEPGIGCVAIPLLRSSAVARPGSADAGAPAPEGSVVAAVSITVPLDRLPPERRRELHRLVHAELGPRLPAGLSLPSL